LSAISQVSIERYFDQQRALVEGELERLLPAAEEDPPVIHRAMRYAVFAGGKRLRPILCLESGRLVGGKEESLLPLAGALELIHTYSLIHDDLPALDNDDLRRGKPTCHRAFGEAMAILAGDALLTRAFEVLSSPGPLPAERKLQVIHALAGAIGTQGGMVAGQVVDLATAGQKPDAARLEFIHSAKTGAFIRVAVRAGAICAAAPEPDLERLTQYGAKVGLAFQIVDDLLDVLGSKEALGKAVGKDGKQLKATYPALYGIEESRRIAAKLVQEACAVLEPYGGRAEKLQQIAQYLLVRNS
jgi:geranylgeranyl diphosphate synthase, type II